MAKTLPTGAVNIASCNNTTYKELGTDNIEYDCIAGCFTFDFDLSAEYVNPKDSTKTCHIKLAFPGENSGEFLAGFLNPWKPITLAGCVDRHGVVTFCNASVGNFLNKEQIYIIDAETNEPYKLIGFMNFANLALGTSVAIADYE